MIDPGYLDLLAELDRARLLLHIHCVLRDSENHRIQAKLKTMAKKAGFSTTEESIFKQ